MAKRSSMQSGSGNEDGSSSTNHFELGSENAPDLLDPLREIRVENRIRIEDIEDIVQARHEGRVLATSLGFSASHATLVATAISELARNIVLYAKSGEIILSAATSEERVGMIISAVDDGPGIPNIQHAMMSGFSSSGGLGLGLPGVKQIVDEFSIESELGKGTRIVCTFWR